MKALRPKSPDWRKPFRIFEKRDEFKRADGIDQEMIIARAAI